MDHDPANKCNKKKRKKKVRNIYTTKIMEICINHNNDYYTFIELDYVPNLPHSNSSK